MQQETHPHLREKFQLLIGRPRPDDLVPVTSHKPKNRDDEEANEEECRLYCFRNDGDLVRAMSWNHQDFCHAISNKQLPRSRIPSFLRLFTVPGVPDKVEDDDEWDALARKPLLAFCAEVASRGGVDVLSCPWDRFVADATAGNSNPGEEGRLLIEAAPFALWHRSAESFRQPHRAGSTENAATALQVLQVGHRARVALDIGSSINWRPAHVFLFQDVIIDADHRRRFIPMLPAPEVAHGFVMPEPLIVQGKDYLYLPLGDRKTGELGLFAVPAGWGFRRRLVAVVTEKPVVPEIYNPSEKEWEIHPNRLDNLVVQLSHMNKFGAWHLFVFDYLVSEPQNAEA